MESSELYSFCLAHQINFFCGVPDSLLKEFCAFIKDQVSIENHIITANEGAAIGIAAGHYMGSKTPALVYMQNSGLGNAINPLTSLADPLVYSIPMLLVVGWRGEPDVKDEPQHIKQGAITKEQLDILDIPTAIIASDTDIKRVVGPLIQRMKEEQRPVALLVKKNCFAKYPTPLPDAQSNMSREAALSLIVQKLKSDCLYVATTGKTSRELYEIREAQKQPNNDFLTVGSMGHASSIALGVALQQPEKRVIVLDGDGAALMHMGSLAIVAQNAPENFLHVVLNNGCHESVGGQPTVANQIDLAGVAKAVGYKTVLTVSNESELSTLLEGGVEVQGPAFLEVRVSAGSRAELGRPKTTPLQNRDSFMSLSEKPS